MRSPINALRAATDECMWGEANDVVRAHPELRELDEVHWLMSLVPPSERRWPEYDEARAVRYELTIEVER